MKPVSLAALLCFFSYFISHAQTFPANRASVDTIKGVVIDSTTKMAIGHVTVELYDLEKSRTIKNTLTDESGYFEITTTYRKHCQIQFSSIGYKAITRKLSNSHSSSLHLGQIALASVAKQLKEVQVSAKKPLIEQDVDKITYNVDADPESKTETAFEILHKIPLLSIDAEDNLQLNGNSNYTILINGKASSLFSGNQSDIFKNISASAIKAIEVMTVPPSKYGAQGVAGVINLITYREITGGYNGGMSVRASHPQNFSGNSNLMAKFGKISLSGNFGYNTSVNPTNSTGFFRQDKIKLDRLEQTGTSEGRQAFRNMGGEIRFALNSLNLLTVGYGSNKGKSESDFNQDVTLFNATGRRAEGYRHLNAGSSQQYGNDLALDYQRNFRKNDAQQLTLSYKRTNSTDGNTASFVQQLLMNRKRSANTTNNDDEFDEQSFQADYVQPVKKHTLELGVIATLRKSSSDYFYKSLDTVTGIFVPDTSQSNTFLYKEDLLAAYTSFHLVMGKWALKSSVRLEQAKVDAQFVSSSTVALREYRNYLPAVSLSRRLKGSSTIRLAYTQRLNRPSLGYLNPFVDRTDPWNISYGNPDLQPALAHVFQLSYNASVRTTFLHLSVFHQFTNNSILQYTVLGADTVARTTFGNIGQNRSDNISLGMNTTFFKNLSLNLNGAVNYILFTRMVANKPYTNKGLTYNVSGALTFRAKKWRISGNASYSAPNVLLQGKSAGYVSNSFSLNKQFLKNQKATVGMQINSPFQERRRTYTETNDPAFYLVRESYSTIRRFSISLSYRFGKVQAGTHK